MKKPRDKTYISLKYKLFKNGRTTADDDDGRVLDNCQQYRTTKPDNISKFREIICKKLSTVFVRQYRPIECDRPR